MVHAVWNAAQGGGGGGDGGGALCLWGEFARDADDADPPSSAAPVAEIVTGLATSAQIRAALASAAVEVPTTDDGAVDLILPAEPGANAPAPSDRLLLWSGMGVTGAAKNALASDSGGSATTLELAKFAAPALRIPASGVWSVLDALDEASRRDDETLLDEASGHEPAHAHRLMCGDSVRWYAAAARLARSLLVEQRFVPMAEQDPANPFASIRASWRAWLNDDATLQRISLLLQAMPPSARAAVDAHRHQPVAILSDLTSTIVDAWARRVLRAETMIDAIDGRDPLVDPHVSLLSGLLDGKPEVPGEPGRKFQIPRAVRRWIGSLEERGASGQWRLCLRINEPTSLGNLADLAPPPDEVRWTVSIHMQSIENPSIVVDAEDIWALHADSAIIEGQRLDQPQELLLGELGRASRLWKPLESTLSEATPTEIELNTRHAYEFLREVRPILLEQGFGVMAPEWWETPHARLGARLKLDSGELPGAPGSGPGAPSSGPAAVGLSALVSYQWQLAIGDTPLSLQEFEALAQRRAPLVRINGRWVEVRPEDIKAAVDFIKQSPGGEMRVGEALRLAYATDAGKTGVPILGIEATGWIKGVLDGATSDNNVLEMIEPPANFHGELRPYQVRGLSWLAFLDRAGLGPCLADDMGLGKTIQLLAMLLHERRDDEAGTPRIVAPTLLVVPMSIVGNWTREAHRFAPSLKVLVHHGSERKSGEAFLDAALKSDLIVTTYALVNRDLDELSKVGWHRVVLDEAQNIKNPGAKQSKAVRSLDAPRRIALTGTPLENRLSELWSILDFCNPGLMGGVEEFRRNFAVPIERFHDKGRSRQLKGLVRPFVLRRLKTDPGVISDLPEKIEMKEFCRLTTEQATLYENTVKTMLAEVERSEGIRRRGVVLTTLIRLKQICNHPAQFLKGRAEGEGSVEGDITLDAQSIAASRSGKCIRILEMLDEVLASNAQALIFTQFRQMGSILQAMLRHSFEREVLFLHGGVPQKQRDAMVARFQKSDGTAPLFVLSLKAGGVGLNLTGASHVFHFDRWWNPAVENQATDRAFRIGQTKRVNVHKFVVSGTLEERIDQMIESKIALAEDVIGSGEEWLTELSTSQLRELLALRPDALVEE
ncbi:MAG: DEAD/DEAH box helicase [Phycisphaerales bacterium]